MNSHRPSWWSNLARWFGATAAASLLTSSCVEGTIGEPGASCESARSYFLTNVWGKVMAQRCLSCHAPGGTAQLRGARFQLLPASYPDFADANLAMATELANTSYVIDGERVSALLAKPMGRVNHGGGSIIQEGTPEYEALAELVDRVGEGSNQDLCRDYGSLAAPSGVDLLSWRSTLRKAALDLVGRLPTDAEYARGATEEGFKAVLATMMEEPAFYRRWRTAWNDQMLTDRYITADGCDQRALNLISNEDFPNRGTYGGAAGVGELDCCGRDRGMDACRQAQTFFLQANNAVAQEPINLFDYIIRNNRSFSEILTADYTMVNPQSAHVYGVSDEVNFGGSYEASDLRPARIRYTWHVGPRNGMPARTGTEDFPHAGVLTMPVFLARYPTTETNRNRHRARMVQSFFLATDILKVGERPLDPTASEALVQTPTLNYGPCVTCHRINDPIAGAFRAFPPQNNNAWRYDPLNPWYADIFPPGVSGENMPASSYSAGLKWLAPRITSDPRFASSVVFFVYKALTGREPLAHPTDMADPLYNARSAAWNEQDRIFRAISRRFTADGMNFKTIVAEMVRSPLYRAVGVVGENARANMESHAGLGTAQLISPEVLDRRIRAIAGFGWVGDVTRNTSWLLGDFYYPYGGINSDTIVKRATDPSGIIVGVAQRMANEVSCRATSWDFTHPQAERRFFRRVRLDTSPESGGQPVPNNIALIRQNIADLHSIILDEQLSPDSPEVTRTYNLFLETWREASTSGAISVVCRGTADPATGTVLAMNQQINTDTSGTIRAWMAVMTYLFSDYRFLYQ
jgi:mono/diheme cytochrome c family protein